MASRLNIRFVSAPKQFLERTVLFSDGLLSPESTALTRNRLTQFFDFEPIKERAAVRVLAGQHLYSNDTHVTGYFVRPGSSTIVPKSDTPHPFVFLSEFTCCRLLVRKDGDDWLRLEMEENLVGRIPPAESGGDSRFIDSFAYWDYTGGDLVGRIRGTAVLVKEPGEPWTIYMQQIVGSTGFEQVRLLFSRQLRY
ncbi:MAG TPA: hypothetical protein VHZ07_22125 [Bryobacteraceae bacterium]|jgi:hypothetical protein|nr:hypothetical protein [Bryobacteraceae bacterium]